MEVLYIQNVKLIMLERTIVGVVILTLSREAAAILPRPEHKHMGNDELYQETGAYIFTLFHFLSPSI